MSIHIWLCIVRFSIVDPSHIENRDVQICTQTEHKYKKKKQQKIGKKINIIFIHTATDRHMHKCMYKNTHVWVCVCVEETFPVTSRFCDTQEKALFYRNIRKLLYSFLQFLSFFPKFSLKKEKKNCNKNNLKRLNVN